MRLLAGARAPQKASTGKLKVTLTSSEHKEHNTVSNRNKVAVSC